MVKHLYIHIPFCDGKCAYCAFYSVPFEPHAADLYLESLARELVGATEGRPPLRPETIYMGGGTPSVLGADRLSRLVKHLARHIDLSGVKEWSMEVNPGNLETGLLDQMREAGVNRVSLGVQSFDDEVLRAMGRRHRAADSIAAVGKVRDAGITNWGLDLIASFPGVTPQVWQDSLRQAMALEPYHLSVYGFSIEPGTQMDRLCREGQLAVPSEEDELTALDTAGRAARTVGLQQIEVSNYARPGFACAHNLGCWRGCDYLGLGPAASSRLGRQRWTNGPDLATYAASLSTGIVPPRHVETLDPDTDVTERFMFRFRLVEGVDLGAFQDEYAPSPARVTRWEHALAVLSKEGLVTHTATRWQPTPLGLRQADRIARQLL